MLPPHLAYPFRVATYGAGQYAVTVEEDSADEIAQCVFAIIGTPLGERANHPTLGIEDPTFSTLDLDEVRSQINQFEPRASAVTDSELKGLVQRVSVESVIRQS